VGEGGLGVLVCVKVGLVPAWYIFLTWQIKEFLEPAPNLEPVLSTTLDTGRWIFLAYLTAPSTAVAAFCLYHNYFIDACFYTAPGPVIACYLITVKASLYIEFDI